MIRVGFTIVLNGIHHLRHNEFANSMTDMLDLWVIVEGACMNNGSTSWCRSPLPHTHNNGRSVDGTTGYLSALKEGADNVRVVQTVGLWDSKDEMVNAALDKIRSEIDLSEDGPVFLWEFDVDEQWDLVDICNAEDELMKLGASCGQFRANFFVGKNLVAIGDWGEGGSLPYNRLWLWHGQRFEKHEPPVLEGGNGREVVLKPRFDHYAYYFEKDVMFKDEWYGNHAGIHEKWKELQNKPASFFPCDISELTPFNWASGKTQIHHIVPE